VSSGTIAAADEIVGDFAALEEAEDITLDFGAAPVPAGASSPQQARGPLPAADLEDVFVQMRGEVSRKSIMEAAEAEYRRALALHEAGDLEACAEALRAASRAPSLRFATASLLGRIHKQRGQLVEAVQWFEQAAQAPAPTPADYHALLFELVDGLEASGDVTRALAIGLELQADAGTYRDVAERVDRLAKAQARG
jgi:tetratricopeptide (TPR) repeat protein